MAEPGRDLRGPGRPARPAPADVPTASGLASTTLARPGGRPPAGRRLGRRLAGCVALLQICLPLPSLAQPGTTLFYENLNGNLNDFTVVSAGGDASIGNETANQGRSLRLRWGEVSVHTDPIAAAVPGAELTVWIRRGDDSFSEDPDAGEDLVIEYRDAGSNWIALDTFEGDGTPGEILTPTYALPGAALHASLSIRFRLTDGNGSDNDYWHVDDVRVTETAGAGGGALGVGTCEDFEAGLGGWTVTAAGGDAGISAVTAGSPSNSLYTRWGAVTVTSQTVDLAAGSAVNLGIWVQRGSDAFSENPEGGEDLVLEILTSGGSWTALETFPGDGAQGEVLVRSYPLPVAAYHAGFRLRLRQTAGNGSDWDYWHVDDVCLSGSQALLFSFEEDAWTGAAGEIGETNGSGVVGTVRGGASNDNAAPALATNPGTCRYGVFDGSNDYIEIADDPALDMSSELTASAWIYMHSYPGELHTIVSKDWNYEFHINSSGRVYWWWNDPSGNVRSFETNQGISLNRWYHVAITYASGRQVIYVDGTPWASRSHNGGLRLNDLPLHIGTDWNFISRAFDGYIDEVHIAPREYSQAEVQALRDATHPCATAAAQFSINHDAFGIHCLPETITIDVVDSTTGTPLNSYNGQVRLDTQSGSGTWSLLAGSGAFSDMTADDGVAYYEWPLGESQVQVSLYYPQGPAVIDVDAEQASDPGIRDTDAEGALTFSPNGFTVTAAPLVNPPGAIVPFADPQTAAVPFAVHIAAYGQTASDPVCGVIETYSGNRNLKFWSEYINPGSGSRTVAVDGVAVATSEAGAADQTVAFVNGQASVTLSYKDAGRIRLAMKDDTTAGADLPAGIRGATAGFVSRPADFELTDIRDAAGVALNPEAADAAGPVFLAAGAPFRATVTAVDADGDPTPNFGRESPAASVELEPLLVAPVAGQNPPIAAATGFASFSGGAATGSDFSWSEVGIVRLRPGVAGDDYLGSGDIIGSDSPNVGRFVPDHFELALNAPMFETGCTTGAVGFTYTGEPFGYLIAPSMTATARSVGGGTTLNYTGAFFRMTGATLANRSYTAAAGTLDTSAVPPAASDPVVSEQSPGIASIRFDSGGTTSLRFARAAVEAPFDASITLAVDIFDLDGIAAQGNPAVFDGGGAGIAFDGGRTVRYGRLRFTNAYGSERVDLPVPLVAEYFVDAATGFVANTDDACTTGVSLAFLTWTGDLGAGETCVRDSGSPGASGLGCAAPAAAGLRFAEPPQLGDFGVRLAAPGVGNAGSVIIDSVVPAWLRFDWNAAIAGDENPAGIASFGLYGGEDARIYLRELF